MIDASKPVRIHPHELDHLSRIGCSDPLLISLRDKDLEVVDARATGVYVRNPETGWVHFIRKALLKIPDID